ncbi:TMEM165/GDT1 family protein [Magnetofaba australis]|uniref:GDT1 family protein n=1 Tax=Magnetofaba australis IT-1 TaxID=1434232 RepID=A0A1Y2K4W7_9PROT|nr:TMEM165/GDT1 family protein [Magnetofaba australis]OSM04365.1 hypothetical protein MAIT1_04263 [Magnetofaba australis IT-1]
MDAWLQPASAAFALIALAEIGDKSQLVCLTLAARHRRARPVIIGAVAAFALLNALAALFGAALSHWIPRPWLLAAVALLFAWFGVQALREASQSDDEEEPIAASGRSVAVSAFLLIFLAEMGDKTQLSVAALAGIHPPEAVWLGATMALTFTSALGAVAGKTVFSRLPLALLHRLAGGLFLLMAAGALWGVFNSLPA